MGCDEPIAPTTAMLAAMKKSEQSIDRNRGTPDVRFRFVIMEVPSLSLTIRDHSHPSRFYPTTREVVNNFVPVFRAQPLSGERPRPACWRWRPRHGGLFFVLSIRSQLPCVCTDYFGATPKPTRDARALPNHPRGASGCGAGVGRSRGVTPDLGVGVGLGVASGVPKGVGVALGVGVGLPRASVKAYTLLSVPK